MKKLSIINKIIYFVNIILALLLLASYLLPFISPEKLPILAVLSLFVPFLIFVNIIFAVYWLLTVKKQILLSLIILLIGWLTLTPIYKFLDKKIISENSISVMSYNVRLFNLWDWKDDKKIPEKINTFIQEKSPDILLFQDYLNPYNYSLKH